MLHHRHARISSTDEQLNAEHPILGNFDLPVEIEGAGKLSGIQNLAREGWGEDACRNFLVTKCAIIPRNYKYEDGLGIIHNMLLGRFGDENLDLACGVLEEMIEVEASPPFPECIFQCWKYDHRRRAENFRLPHVPRTKGVIIGKIQPTEKLLEWRQNNPRPLPIVTTITETTADFNSTNVSTISASFSERKSSPAPPASPISPTLAAVHVDPSFRIANTVYVSTGGQKATVHRCPNPEEFHNRLWDGNWGSGGKLVGTREVIPCSVRYNGMIQKTISYESEKDALTMKEGGQKGKTPVNDTRAFVLREPNARFARKHKTIGDGDILDSRYQYDLIKPSLDEVVANRYDEVHNDAVNAFNKLPDVETYNESKRQLLELQATHRALQTCKVPLSPGLFFDGGLDFKWDTEPPLSLELSRRSNTVIWVGNVHSTMENIPPPQKLPRYKQRRCSLGGVAVAENGVVGLWRQVKILATTKKSKESRRRLLLNSDAVELDTVSQTLEPLFPWGLDVMPDHSDDDAQNYSISTESESDSTTSSLSNVSDFRVPGKDSLELIETEMGNKIVSSVASSNSAHSLQSSPGSGYTMQTGLDKSQALPTSPERSAAMNDNETEVYTLVNSGGSAFHRELNSAEHTRPAGQEVEIVAFDGAAEYFDFPSKNQQPHRDNTYISNAPSQERAAACAEFNTFMGVDHRLPRLSSALVNPLRVQKQPSGSHLVRSQQYLSDNNTHSSFSEQPIFPPRNSSIHNHQVYHTPETFKVHETRNKTPFIPINGEESTYHSVSRGHHISDTSIEAPSTATTAARSTLSSCKSQYHSDTSSAIMGDFVPIDSPDMAGLQTTENAKVPFPGASKPLKSTNAVNLYEFEAPSPYDDRTRQTTFTDFIRRGQEVSPTLIPRSAHVKNSRSEGNAFYMTQSPSHLDVPPAKQTGYALHRSESSPNVSQNPFPQRRNATPSPDIIQYYIDTDVTGFSLPRGRQRSQDPPCNSREGDGKYASPSRRGRDFPQELASRSPTRPSRQDPSPSSYVPARHLTRSPTKTLDDVSERDEYETALPDRSSSPPHSSPKKRSRSPMKKMFGDNGWLGQSPDEKFDPRLYSKKSSAARGDFTNRPKKTGMIGKLKNKFEEIAEKADLSPMRGFRSENDKQLKLSILSISLGPPHQARIYMEVELMLVHTGNSFLMNQFSQGRMDVDSIKRTVDSWKSKGRPTVIEFMYDQATQRELVVANQQNFRFHGDRAGHDVRINSMLYNWKQVANLMAVRTFCNADTVILKLLFDIEQILELLGAGEPMMVRLQQIRASANEMMQIARRNKDTQKTSQNSSRGGQASWKSYSSGSASHTQSMDDPYGGLKLVPDSYVE